MREALSLWFTQNKRDLPWRTNPSLYATVVSEFMLQQTQVKTVLPYFDRWMKRFPDFKSLASASGEEVLKNWEGLGYYSRARNLHKLAREIAQFGEASESPEAWQQFKGIGTYTATAITSIAFRHPVACVDGNVIRILARLSGDSTEFKDSNQAFKKLSPLAGTLLNESDPGNHNEAMMELGATVCTKSNPKCAICPFNQFCAAKGNNPERYPVKKARQLKKETVHRAWMKIEDKILLHRSNVNSRRLANLLELPRLEHLGLQSSKFEAQGVRPVMTKRRGISNSQIREHIWNVEPTEKLDHPEVEWVSIEQLPAATLSGPHKRWIQELLDEKQLTLI